MIQNEVQLGNAVAPIHIHRPHIRLVAHDFFETAGAFPKFFRDRPHHPTGNGKGRGRPNSQLRRPNTPFRWPPIAGPSASNAMIATAGQSADYVRWRQLGLSGWGYDDVLPAFRRLEGHFLGASAHHGTGGGWRIEAPRLSWDILDAVGNAAE